MSSSKNKVFNMKKYLSLVLCVFVLTATANTAQAFDKKDLAKLKKTNQCIRCDLSNLSKAHLHRAKLKLSGADLSGANLSRAKLGGANLTKAKLRGANLTKAKLFGANLTKATLSRAKLGGANLTWAKLTRADLSGANLTKANL